MKWFPFVRRGRLKDAIAQRDAALAELDRLKSVVPIFMKGADGLAPIAICRSRSEWEKFRSSDDCASARKQDEEILSIHQSEETWWIAGYSAPARRGVIFKVDTFARVRSGGVERYPTLRESLVCPVTGLNNRQRLVAALVERELAEHGEGAAVYCMEHATPFYDWAVKALPRCDIIGSAVVGAAFGPGETVDGVRHKNPQNLGFEDASIDFVVRNDVLTHVTSPRLAFTELARVMRPGSHALMTFPFFPESQHSETLAEINDQAIRDLNEHAYQGDPAMPDGSLVFTGFGWDLFDLVKDCGFKDMSLEIYHSVPFGHLGLGFAFRLVR